MFPHESNIHTKITGNYHGLAAELTTWRNDVYSAWRDENRAINGVDRVAVDHKTQLFENYYRQAQAFRDQHRISSQSKFLSSVLEEFCHHLLDSLPEIAKFDLRVSDRNLFTDLSFSGTGEAQVGTKDVDFCIAKPIQLTVGANEYQLNVPLISIEVKSSYVDKTMLVGLMETAQRIKHGSSSARCYVVAETKAFRHHLVATSLDEIFILKRRVEDAISSDVIWDFYCEVRDSLQNCVAAVEPSIPGRLLRRTVGAGDG